VGKTKIKMKKTLSILSICFLLFSCTNENVKGKFTVNANVKNIPNQQVYLEELYFSNKAATIVDTAELKEVVLVSVDPTCPPFLKTRKLTPLRDTAICCQRPEFMKLNDDNAGSMNVMNGFGKDATVAPVAVTVQAAPAFAVDPSTKVVLWQANRYVLAILVNVAVGTVILPREGLYTTAFTILRFEIYPGKYSR
jgi:hypothetical protein